MNGDVRLLNFKPLSRGYDGKIADVGSTLIDNHKGWTQCTVGTETAGDAAANGTSITTLSIAGSSYFVCTHLAASTDVAAVLKVGTGTLASMTDVYFVDLYNSLSFVAVAEAMPLFHYDNTSSSSAVNLIMYAPQTAMGVATNNDANHHFYGFMGGITYKSEP